MSLALELCVYYNSELSSNIPWMTEKRCALNSRAVLVGGIAAWCGTQDCSFSRCFYLVGSDSSSAVSKSAIGTCLNSVLQEEIGDGDVLSRVC